MNSDVCEDEKECGDDVFICCGCGSCNVIDKLLQIEMKIHSAIQEVMCG
jgi:hypothetical protein